MPARYPQGTTPNANGLGRVARRRGAAFRAAEPTGSGVQLIGVVAFPALDPAVAVLDDKIGAYRLGMG